MPETQTGQGLCTGDVLDPHFFCVIQANCVPNSAEDTDERLNLSFFFDDQMLTWLNEHSMWTLYELQRGTRSVVHCSTVDLA